MRLPPAPTFPVGPEVSRDILDILSSSPHSDEAEIASLVGADPSHPFFQTDLDVARAWIEGDSFPEHRIRSLEREQRFNVYVAIALRAAETIGLGSTLDVEDLRRLLPIMRSIDAANVPVDHVAASLTAMDIADRIEQLIRDEAGEMLPPIETLLRDYLKLRPDGLSEDRAVDEGSVKKVLSDSSVKDGATHRADGETRDPTTGVSTEGTSDGKPELEVETERPP
jgi:hypothetical protein